MNPRSDLPRCGKTQAWGMGFLRCDKHAGHDEHNFVLDQPPPTASAEERAEAAIVAGLGSKAWDYLSTKKKRSLLHAVTALVSTSVQSPDKST